MLKFYRSTIFKYQIIRSSLLLTCIEPNFLGYSIKSSRIGLKTSIKKPDSKHTAPCITFGGM